MAATSPYYKLYVDTGYRRSVNNCVYSCATVLACLVCPLITPLPLHATWRSRNVVGRINEVVLRRARLVLGWVTVFGGQTISVFHQAT